LEKSWERIFDITWIDPTEEIAMPPKDKSIQGMLWEIVLKDVVGFKGFTGR